MAQFFFKKKQYIISCPILLAKHFLFRAVVVAQLVEQSLPTPEVRSSNPVIGKIYIEHLLSTVLKFEKTKIEEKEAGNGPFKKQYFHLTTLSSYKFVKYFC